ncbi:MAG: HNH endonuclease [Candidatus Hodarchaeales archaeon]|jgi:hypothetical protein
MRDKIFIFLFFILIMPDSLPKAVPKFWKIFIDQDCQLLTAHFLANQLKLKPNSVLQTVNRNSDFFLRFNKKPVLIGVKAVPDFILTRDNHTCLFCYQQFEPQDLQIDFLEPSSDDTKLKLNNSFTICKPCLSKRYSSNNRSLNIENYIQKELKGVDQKKAVTRLQFIRNLPNYSEDGLQENDTDLPSFKELSLAINQSRNELSDIKGLIRTSLLTRKKYEYLEVLFEYYSVPKKLYMPKSHKPHSKMRSYISYWSWNYNPDVDYSSNRDISNKENNYYLGKDGSITNKGEPSPNSTLEVGLNVFGQHGYDIVHMTIPPKEVQWDSTTYDVSVIFKRGVID